MPELSEKRGDMKSSGGNENKNSSNTGATPGFRHYVGGGDQGKAPKGHIIFDASFECGNLGGVTQISDQEFDLSIRPDTNNDRYRVWFYFSIRNTKMGQTVLFNIINFSKTKSLYRQGMGPLVCSTSRRKWERLPEKAVFYYKSPRHKDSYILSWFFTFDNEDDVFYFSYCFPYSYTDLQRYLYSLDQRGMPFYKRELLCRTLQNRRLDMITITNPNTQTMHDGSKKKLVFITARVHPGETPASFICQGIIEQLMNDSYESKVLRDNLIFKIVPMLNPDGVFLGNYRTSYLGYDLNRHWLHPSAWGTPTIYATKSIVMQYNNEQNSDLDFFIDIHAHSTMMNGFMFCNIHHDSESIEKEIVFPKMLDSNCKDFSFRSSKFCRDPSKAGTGRRALGDFLVPRPHCYTLEVSFYCTGETGVKSVPFTEESYTDLGRKTAYTFLDFYKLRSRKDRDKAKSGK